MYPGRCRGAMGAQGTYQSYRATYKPNRALLELPTVLIGLPTNLIGTQDPGSCTKKEGSQIRLRVPDSF